MIEQGEDSENSLLTVALGDLPPETKVLPDSLKKGICSYRAHTLSVNNLLYTANEAMQLFLHVQ